MRALPPFTFLAVSFSEKKIVFTFDVIQIMYYFLLSLMFKKLFPATNSQKFKFICKSFIESDLTIKFLIHSKLNFCII